MEFRTFVIESGGRPVAGASVSVRTANTPNEVVVYAEDEVTVLDQPLVSNAKGEIAFAAPNGDYDLFAINGSASNTIENVTFFDFAGAIDAIKTGSDNDLLSGTAGTDGNILAWNADGDAVDGGVAANQIVTLTGTQTVTGKTIGLGPNTLKLISGGRLQLVDDFSDLADLTSDHLGVGEYVGVINGAHWYERAADAASDEDLDYSGSGGVKLYVKPGADGRINVRAAGAKGNWDNSAETGDDDQPAFQIAVDAAEKFGAGVLIPDPETDKEFYLGSHVLVGAGGQVSIFHPGGRDNRIVRKAGDDYAFVIADSPGSDFCSIEGFAISGQGPSNAENNDGSVENYPAVLARRRCFLDLTALFCGGPDYPGYSQFEDTGSGSKCFAFGLVTKNTGGNYSKWTVGAKQCFGDAFFCGSEAGSRETQALDIEIWTSFQNTGYAFNIHKGFRNRVLVRHCEGGSHEALGRFGDAENFASTIYCEGNVGTGYVFDAGQNYAEMQNETMATPLVLNNNNNEYKCYGPTRKHYLGLNGVEYSGSAPNFTNGIKIYGSDLIENDTYVSELTPETSGSITLNTSFDELAYQRIGDTVLVTGQLNVASVSSPVGSYVEVLLPFNIANLAGLGGRFYATVYRNDTGDILPLNGVGEGGDVARMIVDASTITSADSFGFCFSYRAE